MEGISGGDALDAACNIRFGADTIEKHEAKKRGFTLMPSVTLNRRFLSTD